MGTVEVNWVACEEHKKYDAHWEYTGCPFCLFFEHMEMKEKLEKIQKEKGEP